MSVPSPAPAAAGSGATLARPSLSGAQTEAELQALARGPGPLTAAGEAARALDPQALKAALAEPAQARTVLSALMASAGKLDTAALPPAGQKLVEALKGLQADADSLSDPARLKAAVDAVLGLAASATGAMAAGLQRKGDVPQKTDGLTMLLVRLAGLADEALAAQPQLPSGRKGAAQAGRGGMPSSLDPETAAALAQKTGAEVGERVRLQSVSRMAAEYLIRDMARAAGKGAAQESQAGQARAVSGATAGAAPAGTSSGAPAARPVDVSLDLPVLIDGQSRVLSLRISRDPQNPDVPADPKGPEWRVRFSLDLPEGGLVEAAAGLRGTSSYVTLRAAEDETLAGFLSRRETLAALFADEGLDLEDLRILKAKPEAAPAIAPLPLDRSS
ncbi:flagellar hook-length control protein FliK [Pannonibacter phragmitetus]|uniref:flagellar hook-length control protein FliK n=1 Tax=Pannonibacter phragmitetus TaxID=121719 RepID=UPI0012DC5596|nr:flagellar hook-length control protein FliK [Pannonibacter phragmitetus]